MMAVWFLRFFRWRSMQLYETFSTPSSNQRIETFGYSKVAFFIFLGDLNQSIRFACLAQNLSGSLTNSAYIFR